ncbi:MAG: TetR/AcrR family transcriptional regulator [Bacilli bacterium]|nr:TetR/AcrR family transcriptional regulator [Bacilli bacterium]
MEDKSKRTILLSSAYKLFTKKGINKTTIQDIVDAARVAKGTFYLYFEDKYKLQEELIIEKSEEIFNNAIDALNKKQIKKFDDQIIFVVDYVIDYINNEPAILNFISKDLSLGIYEEKLTNIIGSKETKLYDLFLKGVKENNLKIKNPEITLFMIFEVVSATCFSVITKKIDLSINEYKPYVHNIIKSMLNI